MPSPSLTRYKKSAQSVETYWHSCLALIPGVSPQTAHQLQTYYPNMLSLVEEIRIDTEKTVEKISTILINEKRKIGKKQAYKIVHHILNQRNEDEKIKISV